MAFYGKARQRSNVTLFRTQVYFHAYVSIFAGIFSIYAHVIEAKRFSSKDDDDDDDKDDNDNSTETTHPGNKIPITQVNTHYPPMYPLPQVKTHFPS